MQFGLRRPCPHCPFRADHPGFLGERRAAAIIDGLLADDATFACHATVTYGQEARSLRPARDDAADDGADADGWGAGHITDATHCCAGALALQLTLGQLPVGARIAVAVGWLDLATLDQTATFATRDAFVAHHTQES